jgi:hypothetical protein
VSYSKDPAAYLSRRALLQGAASLTLTSLLPGCGFSTNPAYVPPANNPLPSPSGPVLQASVNVSTVSSGSSIPQRFMGLSYEKSAMSYSYFKPSNHNLIALFKRLGEGILRIGGGSVDRVLYLAEGKQTHAEVTPANITALAGFLKATGWLCLYGVNLATSTPALAAEEAAHVASALGKTLLGFEIGNEPDEYGVTIPSLAIDWNFQDYYERWELFRAAIADAVPNVEMTGPATGGGNHIVNWTLLLGQSPSETGVKLLTQHYYRASAHSPIATAAFLVSPDEQLTEELSTLSVGAQQLSLPFRISECNSFYAGGAPGVSNSYASSLWAIDFLFDVAASGATGVNMHTGGRSPGYTPIADDSGGVVEVRPEYYGLLFFTLAGTGDLLETQISSGGIDATAYAVKAANGDLNVMIVNKDETQNMAITIETNQAAGKATLQRMNGPALTATSGVTIQSAVVNTNGSFFPAASDTLTPAGTQVACYVPALSAALITISQT